MRKLIYTLSETLSNYISNHCVRNDQIRTFKNQKTDILLGSTQQVIIRYLLAINSVVGLGNTQALCSQGSPSGYESRNKTSTHLGVNAAGCQST